MAGLARIQSRAVCRALFYQGHFSDDAMPERVYALPKMLLELAGKILQQTFVQKSFIQNALDQGYEAFGILLQEAFDSPEDFPLNAVLAGKTAYNALAEVVGGDIFHHLQRDIVVGRTPQGQLQYAAWQSVTDEVFVLRTGGDTAGAAALAFASNAASTNCDSGRLLEYWQWWLSEAIPQAWELTVQT